MIWKFSCTPDFQLTHISRTNEWSRVNKRLTRIAMVSSSLTPCSAPTSSHVTSGMVAKPSLLADGCTLGRASCWHTKQVVIQVLSFPLSTLVLLSNFCSVLSSHLLSPFSKIRMQWCYLTTEAKWVSTIFLFFKVVQDLIVIVNFTSWNRNISELFMVSELTI